MGRDHVNSNDNGKGADIFNDVPGMVEKVIRKLEQGIKDIEQHNNGYSGSEKTDLSGFDTTVKRITHLRTTVAGFNEKREHKTFRTADGGTGDPKNADKFSNFSKDTLLKIDRLCEINFLNDTYALSKMKNSDWNAVAYCRKFQNEEHVLEHTFDNMAFKARRASLEAGDKKLVGKFDQWHKEAEKLLFEIFKELTAVVEHFYSVKNSMLRKRKGEFTSNLPKPFNNGYDSKNVKPDNGRQAKLKAMGRG
ncbi:hypothetical protein [Chitinophaga sp. S165]|uniref:hypothetical protein n=1 Tax=Chitinophaga sp. S165 TaxID=2135462 RepID=UPI000D7177B1|nr:hypothetical protein [Chitinophaga sp. S165]PWV48767.1 hypothetical protein C7475_1068 [Chitinophaga sp. S165]